MIICVGIILVAYVAVYAFLAWSWLDPNLSVEMKEEEDELIVSIFLIVQFFTQIGQLIIFKRLGTNVDHNNELDNQHQQRLNESHK